VMRWLPNPNSFPLQKKKNGDAKAYIFCRVWSRAVEQDSIVASRGGAVAAAIFLRSCTRTLCIKKGEKSFAAAYGPTLEEQTENYGGISCDLSTMAARHQRSIEAQMLSTTLAGDWDMVLNVWSFLWVHIPQATATTRESNILRRECGTRVCAEVHQLANKLS
jgi:hypothetical protein